MNILILEDNEADFELVKRELRKAELDFTAHWAQDQAAFAAALGTSAPDLVLADYSLPGFDGLAALTMARQRWADVPVIIVSGAIGEEVAIEALRAGATDYVLKQRLGRLGPVVNRALTEARERAQMAQAEEALRESEAKFRSVFEQAALGMGRVRFSDARWIDVNEAFCRMLGYTPEEMCAIPWPQMTHPEDLDLDLGFFHRMAAGELDSYTVEKRFVHKQGHPVWARLTLSMVRDAQGRPDYEVAIIEDITARKRAEEALQRALADAEEGRATLRALMDYIPTGITIADAPDVNIRMVSRYGQELLERAESEIAHIPAPEHPSKWGIYHADGATPGTPEDLPLTRATVHGEIVRNEEWFVTRKDGTLVPILCNAAPIRDKEGKIVGGVIGWQDITERKRVEQALRESRERLELATDATQYGTFDFYPLTGELIWSAHAKRHFGLSSEAHVDYEVFLRGVHPQDRERVDRIVQEALRPGSGGSYQAEYRTIGIEDGQERWLSATGRVYFDEAGRAVRFIGATLDITQRKRAEEALHELNATLESRVARRTAELEHRTRQLAKLALELTEAEDRERRRLAELLHDDLQQQLAAAKFHLDLLGSRIKGNRPLQEAAVQIEGMIQSAIEKTRSLSHQLSPAVLYHGDFGEAVEWLARQIRVKHGLTVRVQARGPIVVSSDPIKAFLFRTIREILFNIVKHAHVAEACVRLRRHDGQLRLTVSDHGRGFDPKLLGQAGGFGLLSIRERVELLGGRMRIRSAPGRGSTFVISVPDARVTEDGEQAIEYHHPSPSGPRLRVLLVDDHKVVREGLAALMSEQEDIEVIGQATNGLEAVNLAHELRPDVVVMDVAMPLMEGDEATRQIKQDMPHTRVVGLSMFAEPSLMERMHRAGAERYVVKTAPVEELLAAIRD